MVWQFLYSIDIRNVMELFLYSSKRSRKSSLQILVITGTKNVRNGKNSSEAGFS